MSAVQISGREATIFARLQYAVDDGASREYLVNHPGIPRSNYGGTAGHHDVPIYDGRRAGEDFDLEVHGFELRAFEGREPDFSDSLSVESIYYPEMERLVMAASGARRVHVFDHTVRHGDEGEQAARKVRDPVYLVHNDYTHWSAPRRVRQLLPEDADELLKRRYAIIQVWRPLVEPVQSDPLAIADARTISEEHFVAANRVTENRVGQTWHALHDPGQRFYYFPLMRPDEALVFKVYDSAQDGRARYTAHTAFALPGASPEDAPRQSVEPRMLAFF